MKMDDFSEETIWKGINTGNRLFTAAICKEC